MSQNEIISIIVLSILGGFAIYGILRYRVNPIHSNNSQDDKDKGGKMDTQVLGYIVMGIVGVLGVAHWWTTRSKNPPSSNNSEHDSHKKSD